MRRRGLVGCSLLWCPGSHVKHGLNLTISIGTGWNRRTAREDRCSRAKRPGTGTERGRLGLLWGERCVSPRMGVLTSGPVCLRFCLELCEELLCEDTPAAHAGVGNSRTDGCLQAAGLCADMRMPYWRSEHELRCMVQEQLRKFCLRRLWLIKKPSGLGKEGAELSGDLLAH